MSTKFHTLGAIQIPRGMVWSDEFEWAPFESSGERSLTGAMLIDVAEKQAGRPITLTGSDDAGWMPLATLQALHALLATPLAIHTLTLADTRVYSVQFSPGAQAIETRPLGRPELPQSAHPHVATLRFITA